MADKILIINRVGAAGIRTRPVGGQSNFPVRNYFALFIHKILSFLEFIEKGMGNLMLFQFLPDKFSQSFFFAKQKSAAVDAVIHRDAFNSDYLIFKNDFLLRSIHFMERERLTKHGLRILKLQIRELH